MKQGNKPTAARKTILWFNDRFLEEIVLFLISLEFSTRIFQIVVNGVDPGHQVHSTVLILNRP